MLRSWGFSSAVEHLSGKNKVLGQSVRAKGNWGKEKDKITNKTKQGTKSKPRYLHMLKQEILA